MKSIFKVISSSLFISLIALSVVAGQDKKNEQKIKIIIDDGSGKKVIVDTLLNDNQMTDSLRLKDGNVIYIGHPEDNADLNLRDGNKQVFVSVTTDGNETKKTVKKITVIRSDSAKLQEKGKGDRIYVYNESRSPEPESGEQYKVIRWSDKDGKSHEEKVIIVNGRKKIGNEGEESIKYNSSDDKKSDSEKTKYVINKDEMVITIEGDDYNKVKELVKEIDSKLDARKDGDATNKPVKAEPKKSVKK